MLLTSHVLDKDSTLDNEYIKLTERQTDTPLPSVKLYTLKDTYLFRAVNELNKNYVNTLQCRQMAKLETGDKIRCWRKFSRYKCTYNTSM